MNGCVWVIYKVDGQQDGIGFVVGHSDVLVSLTICTVISHPQLPDL